LLYKQKDREWASAEHPRQASSLRTPGLKFGDTGAGPGLRSHDNSQRLRLNWIECDPIEIVSSDRIAYLIRDIEPFSG
jgi:hypothetical protein